MSSGYKTYTGDCNINDRNFISIIHGGAGPEDPKGERTKQASASIEKILGSLSDKPIEFQFDLTQKMTSAEKITMRAMQLLEKDPVFNAGLGSALQKDGIPRVSASFMENTRNKFSGIINAKNILNPSELAYFLQHETFSVIDQVGSEDLAKKLNIPKSNLVTEYRYDNWKQKQKRLDKLMMTAPLGAGTVGCVSIDSKYNLAASTSTGGVGNETVGRVGDTPTVAGNYCTSSFAISCTGHGEQIVNSAFAARTATRVSDGLSLEAALSKGLEEVSKLGYSISAVAMSIDRNNKIASWAAVGTSEYFVWGAKLPTKKIMFTDFI